MGNRSVREEAQLQELFICVRKEWRRRRKEGMKERYKEIREIGVGATAQVHLVEEISTGKVYAMKTSEKEELLREEAGILQGLTGNRFPRFKEYEGNCLVMEYIQGKDLQQILHTGKRFSVEETVYVVEEVLRTLEELHQQVPPIIFRDLKPANIMIDPGGQIHLIDFGAAFCKGGQAVLRSGNGAMAGTYGYAAPEQFWSGVEPDARCDIYAAGKVLAYLLSGKNPAEPPYDMESYCKGLKRVPGEFWHIIERSLAMNPLARYEGCMEMLREIRLAYEEIKSKRLFKLHKKSSLNYMKCIWLSEYRRIF